MCRENNSSSIDPFERLPQDIVILIFKKLPHDPKFLMQCSLVSHRFESAIDHAILHVTAARLAFPSLSLDWSTFPDNLQSLKSQLKSSDYFRGLRSQLEPSYIMITSLLKKFTNLRSLYLVVPEDEDTRGFCYIQVKVEPGSQTLVSLQSDLVCRTDEKVHGFGYIYYERKRVFLWGYFLGMLMQDRLMLQRFIISSPNSFMKICMSSSEGLIKYIKNEKMPMGWERKSTKKGFITSLFLPESGYVMNGVCIEIQRLGGEKVPKNVDDIIDWDYGEDDKVFGEAMKSILMNYEGEVY